MVIKKFILKQDVDLNRRNFFCCAFKLDFDKNDRFKFGGEKWTSEMSQKTGDLRKEAKDFSICKRKQKLQAQQMTALKSCWRRKVDNTMLSQRRCVVVDHLNKIEI